MSAARLLELCGAQVRSRRTGDLRVALSIIAAMTSSRRTASRALSSARRKCASSSGWRSRRSELRATSSCARAAAAALRRAARSAGRRRARCSSFAARATTPATATSSRGSRRRQGLAVRVLARGAARAAQGRRARAHAECAAAGVAFAPFDAARRSAAGRRHRRRAARHRASIAPARAATFARPSTPINAARCAGARARRAERARRRHGLAARPSRCARPSTVTFLGLKQGLFLGAAVDHCGELEFARLELPRERSARDLAPPLERLVHDDLEARVAAPRAQLRTRARAAGCCWSAAGPGWPGAIRLAAEAALRAGRGARLCRDASRQRRERAGRAARNHRAIRECPERRPRRVFCGASTARCVGPGLGQSAWAHGAVAAPSYATDLPLVVDADGLNLLAAEPLERGGWLLTPHPGEAARLLGVDRSRRCSATGAAAARALAARYRRASPY